jgi:uncharacterized protein (DUF302 family)
MKKTAIATAAGIAIGIVITVVGMMTLMPKMMIHERKSPLGYEETIDQLTTVITNGGWIISQKINMQQSIAKYGKTIPRVTLLKICQADYAGRILNTDDAMFVSVMMPCTIAVYQKSDGKTYVSTMNTGMMGRLFGGVIAEVMAGSVAKDEAKFTEFLNR